MKRKRAKKKATAVRISKNDLPWWWHLVVLAGLSLANVALYWQALDLGFFSLDDPDYVTNNAYIESVTWDNLVHILTAPYFANYSPLHILSYMFDVAIAGGKSAFAFHLSSTSLWNGFAVCMVYVLAFTVRASIPMAAAAAVLFLAHPAHVEVVAWISSRKDLVATSFGVLSMTLYLLYRRQGKWQWGYYAASVASFLLATAGKQSVVLLPAVMLGWDFFVEKRREGSMVLDKIPFGLITILFALPTMGAQPDTRRSYELSVMAANQIWNFWLLTGIGDYVIYRPGLDSTEWNIMGHALALGLVAIAWVGPLLLYRFIDPVRLMLWFWIILQLIPPMIFNFVTPVTDRYLFLPSIGICLLVADMFFHQPASSKTKASPSWGVRFALVALVGFWTFKAWSYLNEWTDPRSVWYAATTKSRAYQNNEYLGREYQETGDRVNEFVTARKSLDLERELSLAEVILNDPSQVAALKTEWEGKAETRTHSTAYRDRLWDLAWEQFELASARRGTINTPNLFMRRGMILVNRGQHQEAIVQFQRALRFAETHSYEKVRQENVTHIARALGIAYWKLRNYSEAKQWFLRAQQTQQASGQVWIPTIDQEVEQISRLAGSE